VHRLLQARTDALADFVRGWSPDEHPELEHLIRRLAGELLADDTRMLRDARTASVTT